MAAATAGRSRQGACGSGPRGPVAPLAPLAPPAAAAAPRPICVPDVVKALEVAARHLGNAEASISTLRAWAAAGRVTPAGQLLTPAAVDAGIALFLRSREEATETVLSAGGRGSVAGAAVAATVFAAVVAAKAGATAKAAAQAAAKAAAADRRQPATPQVCGAERMERASTVPSVTSTAATQGKSAGARKLSAAGCASAGASRTAATGAAAIAAAAGAAASMSDGGAASKRPRLDYKDMKKERLEAEARVLELTEKRFGEVLGEIDGHMEEIICRASASSGQEGHRLESSAAGARRSLDEVCANLAAASAAGRDVPRVELAPGQNAALDAWRAAPDGADRRELYYRLVHAIADPDVQVPEELRAELLPHQVEGLDWLASIYANGLHGILADEMGLGKTIQTITLLLHLKERKANVGPHLIVAPKSTLANWQCEFARFAPGYTVHVLAVGDAGREVCLANLLRDVERGTPVALVTNYEQVRRNKTLLNTAWQLVVVDEGHKLKNPDTVLHKAMAELRCRMRLLLTGTPLQNNIGELWALLHYLLPELFTQLTDFKSWFSRPFKGIEGLNECEVQLNPEQEQLVIVRMHALLSPFLLQRLKAEVLADKLLPRVEATVRVPLSAWQRSAYADLERRTLKLLNDDESVSSDKVNNALMQLRKIALHPYLFQDRWARDDGIFRASGKVEALDRMLPKLLRFGHKVLIFSQFTSMLDILEEYLLLRKIGSVRLDGQVAHEERGRRIARFNEDAAISVFLLSGRAGGLGLNLQAADTVILFDLDWNPQNDRQAVARAHRVGQTREVRVFRLVSDSRVEMHMEQRCAEKLDMERKIMAAGMFRQRASAEQRRDMLNSVLGGEAAASKEVEGDRSVKTPLTSPEALNRLLARSDEELTAFRRLDAPLLRPKRGAPASLLVEGEAEEVLLRSGRLMGPEEVPRGFAV